MTLTIKEGLEWFRVCAQRGAQITPIEETDDYTSYRIEAPKEVAEIHFNHADDYALLFKEVRA